MKAWGCNSKSSHAPIHMCTEPDAPDDDNDEEAAAAAAATEGPVLGSEGCPGCEEGGDGSAASSVSEGEGGEGEVEDPLQSLACTVQELRIATCVNAWTLWGFGGVVCLCVRIYFCP